MTSPKWSLIAEDLKSWAITTAITLGPTIILGLLEFLSRQDWGSYAFIASLILGSLLKLVQKWQQKTQYPKI